MNSFYQSDPSQPREIDNPPTQVYPSSNISTEAQALSSANLARWFDLDSDNSAPGPKGIARVRRRAPPGSDHVKHRRTRSGCYTCRSRRVKCDETHPICQRCAKGARECVFPEPPSATKSPSSSNLSQIREPTNESDSSSAEYEENEQEPSPVDGASTSEKENKHVPCAAAQVISKKKKSQPTLRQVRTAPSSIVKEQSLSPSADESSALSKSRSTSRTFNGSGKLSSVSPVESQDLSGFSSLPRELQYYLSYHQQYIHYHHYFFKHDATHFVNTTLLELALEYEPLLYAVVGFAAYHMTLCKPNGKVQDFLGYYNRSVQLLLKSLRDDQEHTDATILTILQLATFEEYLGDWVNLISHQKAAYKMLLELYTPETIIQTETSRKILGWYTRFDLFAGLMSGYETVLSREWMVACECYYLTMSRQEPTNLDHVMERNICAHRLLAIDMALLFAKLPRGEISMPEFLRQNELLSKQIRVLKARLEPLLSPEHVVLSFDGAPKRDPHDIVDPYVPGLLYRGALWTMNFMHIDWCAIDAMHKYQTAMILQQPPPAELQQLALEQCRLLEAIEFWPSSPPGATLLAQSSMGLICVLLPRDEKHIMWCRRKLAKVENMGFIYPPTFRTKIAEVWGIPELELQKWWLPNEDGLLPIVKSIRDFVEERTSPTTTNQTSEDVKNMKAMFSKLNMDDSPRDSPEASGSTGNDFGLGSGGGMPGASSMTEQGTFAGIDARIDPGITEMGFRDMVAFGMGIGVDPLGEQFSDGHGAGLWLDPADPGAAMDWSTQTGLYHPPRQ